MQRPDQDETQQGSGQKIAAEAEEKAKKTEEKHWFAGKAVSKPSCKRTCQKKYDGIARQCKFNEILGGVKGLTQVQRKQRRHQKEGKRGKKLVHSTLR